MYKTDKENFLKYQREQGKDVFKMLTTYVSFIGEKGRLSRFIGVFKILSCKKLPKKENSIDRGYYQFEYQIE
ncbi:MAG: hypothetical protein ACI94Y_001551 [Maribacter sp.]